MNHDEINKQLLEIVKQLSGRLIEKHKYEKEYYQKYYKLLLGSPMTNMLKQEAEAKATMFEDPIYDLYQEAKLQIKLLEIEKEVYIEIGRNLRNYEK